MSQTNQSLKKEAWLGLLGPRSHIFPWLGGDTVQLTGFLGSQLTGTAGTGDVHGVSTVMATIDGGSVGGQIILAGTFPDISSNANYNDIEGWAPRIFLKNPDASNAGITPGALNLPWSASNNGRVLPFNFGGVGANGSESSTGIGFVLQNQGGTDCHTAYGSNSSPNPYLQACINRPYFQQTGPPITWKVKVRCTRFWDVSFAYAIANAPELYDDDQGQTSNVDVFLFGTDSNGSYNSGELGSGLSAAGSTSGSPAYAAGRSYYHVSNTNVPFLYEGYGGDGTDYASAVNILSNVTDGVAGGYSYLFSFGSSNFTVNVPSITHQAQYNVLIEKLHDTGWTEIEFYCQFDYDLWTMDGLQIRVDNDTPNSSVLFDYISLQPLNISPGNLYGNNSFAQWPSPFAVFNPSNGGFIFSNQLKTGNGPSTNFSFDDHLD